jgi:hypothetical protein
VVTFPIQNPYAFWQNFTPKKMMGETTPALGRYLNNGWWMKYFTLFPSFILLFLAKIFAIPMLVMVHTTLQKQSSK